MNIAFNRMARDLRQTEADREIMLAGISHDLRTPLARMRSEAHTSELQSLMRISYAVFCLKKKKQTTPRNYTTVSSRYPVHRQTALPPPYCTLLSIPAPLLC